MGLKGLGSVAFMFGSQGQELSLQSHGLRRTIGQDLILR